MATPEISSALKNHQMTSSQMGMKEKIEGNVDRAFTNKSADPQQYDEDILDRQTEGFDEDIMDRQTTGFDEDIMDRQTEGDLNSYGRSQMRMITPYDDFHDRNDGECQYDPLPPGSSGIGSIRRTLKLCVDLNQQNSTTPRTPPSYYHYPLPKEMSNMNF